MVSQADSSNAQTMLKAGDIMPCPFCGLTNLDTDSDGEHMTCRVVCLNCLAEGPEATYGDAVKAHRLWNQRLAGRVFEYKGGTFDGKLISAPAADQAPLPDKL